MPQKPRGQLHSFPGQVLDLEQLPPGTELRPGDRIRHDGRMWTVDARSHCYDDTLVLVREGERWCQIHGAVPMDEDTASGDFGDGIV